MNASRRRGIGLFAWLALGALAGYWLWDARTSLHWLVWPVMLSPIVALLPGMLGRSRNQWLLALLATIGYALTGLMDAIANPESLLAAAVLAIGALAAFFLLIPGIRTLPSAPREEH